MVCVVVVLVEAVRVVVLFLVTSSSPSYVRQSRMLCLRRRAKMASFALTLYGLVSFAHVQTTPQMTRFRDVKVCNNLVTDEIDDHRIQSDCKCTIGQQYPERKNSTLGIAYAW